MFTLSAVTGMRAPSWQILGDHLTTEITGETKKLADIGNMYVLCMRENQDNNDGVIGMDLCMNKCNIRAPQKQVRNLHVDKNL